MRFAWRPEQSWAGFLWERGDVLEGLVVLEQGTRGPVCCRARRELCLALGNLRASFHPTWLPCVSGWYGELDARCLVFTSLTYLWPLIFEGLSCVPTLPSGPITICIVNQAPHPDTSLQAHPNLSHLAPEVDRGPRSGLRLPVHQLTPS